ncbi:N-acetyl sugar amidotransferase [Prochlorococcus marinus]|uniref:N-acetyl sugar amidotransferase n=1 Tax=Prochlorococcus marinus TaxID=1219 RepID=UPI0039AFF898
MQSLYGLPKIVCFCKKCCYSNQRPGSTLEFRHTKQSKKIPLAFNQDGICDACILAEKKKNINWKDREEELLNLLDKYRKNNGDYDCIVPGSGGKDSVYAAHILKYKYNMNPLTVTWPPILYTEYGYKNFRKWIEKGGFDNISWNQNGKAMRILTKLAIENLFHPFQTFILGQKQLAPNLSELFNIKLVFFGEHEAEFGNPISEASDSKRSSSFHEVSSLDDITLSGLPIAKILKDYDLTLNDIQCFLPRQSTKNDNFESDIRYLGYYLKWVPQESYYYSVDKVGFQPRPFRTEGTYSKYLSIDDKIDDLNYYCYYVKFGIGRCTEDASQEIRNEHITREEGIRLVNKFDGEFPKRYFKDVMEYLDIDPDYFKNELTDKFRSPHLWEQIDGEWRLRHNISKTGTAD